jgi:hypothetical protein
MQRLEHNVQTGIATQIEMTETEIKEFETQAKSEADRIANIEEPSLQDKLNNAGISLAELKTALGL